MIQVPLYEGLSIESLLDKASQYPEVAQYLPEDRDLGRLPRFWIANVVYTIVGDEFRTWVNSKIRERNDRVAEKHNLLVEMDNEIARAFQASSQISSK